MKLAWAVSGEGMAARAIMEAHLQGLLETRLDMVISNNTATTTMNDYCLTKGIGHTTTSPSSLESDFLDIQRMHGFDFMGLTFDRLLPLAVIEAFRGNIFNLHLSLLPMFRGLGATKRALRSDLGYTGVSVHFVDTGVDTGPIIGQTKVVIEATDDEASLGRRQFEAAVPLLLQTVRIFERKLKPRFEDIDSDLAGFAVQYCSQVGIR